MNRILVPLDGSALAASIIPDAIRVAGRDGELLLLRDVSGIFSFADVREARTYLKAQAEKIRAQGVPVEIKAMGMADVAMAIDIAATVYEVDMIACATHGRTPMGRLLRGGVAWRALAHSNVPILLRHPEDSAVTNVIPVATTRARRILVPLDGSEAAEKALPLAEELAREWGASIWLVEVVPDLLAMQSAAFGGISSVPYHLEADVVAAKAYLDGVAERLDGEVHQRVLTGSAVEGLRRAVSEHSITDIVMASHGRTGLMRVIVGSVADELVHRLHLPIIIVPALAAKAITKVQKSEAVGPVAAGAH